MATLTVGPGKQYATVAAAQTAASAGDTIEIEDGTYVGTDLDADGYMRLRKAVTIRARNAGAVTFAVSGAQTALVRAQSGFDGDAVVQGIRLDADDCTYAVQLDNITSGTPSVTLEECPFEGNPTTQPINDSCRRGVFQAIGCSVSGGWQYFYRGSASLGETANKTVLIDDCDITLSRAGAITAIECYRYSAGAPQAVLLTAKRNRISVENTAGTGTAIGIDSRGNDNPLLESNDIIVSGATATSCYGIFARAQNSNATCHDAVVRRNSIQFLTAAGYAIALNNPVTAGDAANQMFDPECYENIIEGMYWESATPHGLAIGQCLDARVWGNHVERVVAGYLLSICTDAILYGNLATDCRGWSYLVKGATRGYVVQNTAAYSTADYVPTNPFIHVRAQDAVNTDSTAVAGNRVVVAGQANMDGASAFAKIDASQVCSFDSNCYGTDATIAEPFANGSTGLDLAGWNTLSNVSGEIFEGPVGPTRPDPDSPCVGAYEAWWTALDEPAPLGQDGLRFCDPPSMGAYEIRPGKSGYARRLGAMPLRTLPFGADSIKARSW